jgi:hypothetical protein
VPALEDEADLRLDHVAVAVRLEVLAVIVNFASGSALSNCPTELIGWTIAMAQPSAGVEHARDLADRAGGVVDVLQRHEGDREVGAAVGAAAGRAASPRCTSISGSAARAASTAVGEASRATTLCPSAFRSRDSRPSPQPMSSVSGRAAAPAQECVRWNRQ